MNKNDSTNGPPVHSLKCSTVLFVPSLVCTLNILAAPCEVTAEFCPIITCFRLSKTLTCCSLQPDFVSTCCPIIMQIQSVSVAVHTFLLSPFFLASLAAVFCPLTVQCGGGATVSRWTSDANTAYRSSQKRSH